MTTMMKPFLDRKDIARMLGVSTDTVRRNEDRWGLKSTRAQWHNRSVRYRTRPAMAILLRIGCDACSS